MYRSYFAERAYRRVNFSVGTNTDTRARRFAGEIAEVRVNVGFAGRLSSATASRSAMPHVDFMEDDACAAGARLR
jgi:hypothetical protein